MTINAIQDSMESTSKTSLIREYIAMRLESLGARADSKLSESLLLRDGAYCGHRFRRGEHQADWFIEEDQIKFFLADGSLADKIQTADIQHSLPQRHAA